MMSDRLSPIDPVEALVARTRSSAEAILRRHGVSPDNAGKALLDAVRGLESPHGLVPGAGHRLVKNIEMASRRIHGDAPQSGIPSEADYGPAFDLVVEAVRRRRIEREQATQAFAQWVRRLEAAGADDAEGLAEDPQIEATEGLVSWLIDRSREHWKSDPAKSLGLAQRALSLLGELSPRTADGPFLADLEARSHAYAGNALRLLYDYRRAESEFEAGEAALARGTQDPRERAQLLMQLATLRRDQRHFAEALRQFQQAAAIYRWTRERHAEGMVFMLMATTQAYAGNPELALPLGERARELLDHQRDPRLSAGLEKNMAHYLQAADRAEEARQQVRVARRLVEAAGTADDLRGLRWFEGQIALALGERAEGERLLTEVREEYVGLGNSYDAALVSLELVAVYLDQGRAADAKRLAAESLPIFQSLEIHRETLAALIALQRATEVETATAGVVRELLERMRRGNAAPPPRPEKPS